MALTAPNADALLSTARNLVAVLGPAASNSTLIAKSDVIAAAQAVIAAADLLPEYFPSAGTSGATATRIQSGVKITATVSGTGTTGVTPTIVNGAVTALALS